MPKGKRKGQDVTGGRTDETPLDASRTNESLERNQTVPVPPKHPGGNGQSSAPEPVYEVRKVKFFRGMEGQGFNADLYRDGKKVCFVIDEGSGGCMLYDWPDTGDGRTGRHSSKLGTDAADRLNAAPTKSVELGIFRTHVDRLKERQSDVKHPKYGFSDRDMWGDDMFIDKLLQKYDKERQVKRWCRTKIVFQVGDKIGTEEWLVLKGKFTPEVKARLLKDYPGQRVYIANEHIR